MKLLSAIIIVALALSFPVVLSKYRLRKEYTGEEATRNVNNYQCKKTFNKGTINEKRH